jgi:general secretion pathway protein L
MALNFDAALDLWHRGFGWWIAELRGMLPERLRRAFVAAGPGLAVDLDGEVVVVRAVQAGEDTELGRVDTAGLTAETRRARLQALLPAAEAKGTGEAVLRLPAARVLRKLIDMPAAAAENLREVLSFDIDRQTPFTADQLYFDYAVRTIDRKEGRILIDFVAAPRELVERAAALAGEIGLVPRRVTVAWPDGAGPAVNLLPRSRQPSGPRFLRPLTLALAVLTLALAVAAIVVPLHQRAAVAQALSDRVAEQRKRAEAAQHLETEIEQLTKQSHFIADRKATRPLTVAVLDELTSVLPDDTWLFRYRSTGDEVQIFGYSSAATALIGLIEDSPLFQDTQFRAPLTRDVRNDAERFHIGFRISNTKGSS